MSDISADVLRSIVEQSAEPIVVLDVDDADWPVAIANPAFVEIAGEDVLSRPFNELIANLVSRTSALDVSEAVRGHQSIGVPVDLSGRDYLLAIRPVDGADGRSHVAIYWREADGRAAINTSEARSELQRARRRIRNLRREDPLTGLLNERTFREILAHDWAVAAREQSTLALIVFTIDEFDEYVKVFGRHAADSCLRRVGQTVQRFLRRASDVVARVEDSGIAVLSHAADEDNVRTFAVGIATAVRELGVHHPRSKHGRFVTVSHQVGVMNVARGAPLAGEFLDELLAADG